MYDGPFNSFFKFRASKLTSLVSDWIRNGIKLFIPHKPTNRNPTPNNGLLLRVLQQSLIEITFSMNIIKIHLILPSQIFQLQVLGANTPQISQNQLCQFN